MGKHSQNHQGPQEHNGLVVSYSQIQLEAPDYEQQQTGWLTADNPRQDDHRKDVHRKKPRSANGSQWPQ